jgi:hypothetical protein
MPPAIHALSSEAERRSHAPKVEISKFSARPKSVLSSVAERGPDTAEVAGSFPAGRPRTTFSSAAERSPDKREVRGAAPRRWTRQSMIPKKPAPGPDPGVDTGFRKRSCSIAFETTWPRGSGKRLQPVQRRFKSCRRLQPSGPNITWTSYRSGRTARILNPLAHAHRRFESCLVLQPSRPAGATARQANVRAKAAAPKPTGRRRAMSVVLRVRTPTGRGTALRAHSVGVRPSPGTPRLRYASGEAAALSTR